MAGDSYDYYDILNVSQDAELETITQAYKTLSRIHHPDKSDGSDATFVKLKKAFDVLSDETMRRFYDKYGVAGVEVAELTDRPDLQLSCAEDKLASLETSVRQLVSRHEELQEMRTTQLQGAASMGFNLSMARWEPPAMNSVRRHGLRAKYGQQSTSCAFNTRIGTFTIGAVSHVRHAGGGVVKYVSSWRHKWSDATSSKCSFSTTGRSGDFSTSVTHRVAKNLSLSQEIAWSKMKLSSYTFSGAFDFGNEQPAEAAITIHREGINCQLGGVKSFGSSMSLKTNVQTSKDDLSIGVHAKYEPSDRWSVCLAPTWNLTQGPGMLLETEVQGVPDDLTKITWGLHARIRSLTLLTRLNRGGLSFSLPLEIESQTVLPHPECAVLAVFVFITVPYLLSYLCRDKQTAVEREVLEVSVPGIRKSAAKRRKDESAVEGLVIIQALYGGTEAIERWVKDGESDKLVDVTDALMHKVVDSKLMISGRGRKSGLLGFPPFEGTDSRRLWIRYKYGKTEATRSFDDLEPVHLP